jgi:hypothetical protein
VTAPDRGRQSRSVAQKFGKTEVVTPTRANDSETASWPKIASTPSSICTSRCAEHPLKAIEIRASPSIWPSTTPDGARRATDSSDDDQATSGRW